MVSVQFTLLILSQSAPQMSRNHSGTAVGVPRMNTTARSRESTNLIPPPFRHAWHQALYVHNLSSLFATYAGSEFGVTSVVERESIEFD